MNDAGPVRGRAGRNVGAPPDQGVHQRSRPVARRRMHHHAGRLVDHHKRVVLVSDRQRNGFADYLARNGLGLLNDNDVTGHGAVTRLFAPAVHADIPVGDERRSLVPRNVSALGHKQVEADVTVRLDQVLAAAGRSQMSVPVRETGVTDDAGTVATSLAISRSPGVASSAFSSPHKTHARRNAPMLTAMSASWNGGH